MSTPEEFESAKCEMPRDCVYPVCQCRMVDHERIKDLQESRDGTVKWFNDQRGYGFIIQDSGGQDIFFHHRNITMDGWRMVREGEKVKFHKYQGMKGIYAENVVPQD